MELILVFVVKLEVLGTVTSENLVAEISYCNETTCLAPVQ